MRFKMVVISIFVAMLLGCATTNSSNSAATETKASDTPSNVQKIKGLKDKEGEIVGKPAASSKFKKLQIGMSMKQVTDLIGQPTDQGSYVNGKAFIPFYFGDDSSRTELVYKGLGSLTFAQGIGDTSGSLIRITHDAQEDGYR